MSEAPELLPGWMIDELRRPVPTRAERKARLLELLSTLPPVRRRRSGWRRAPSRAGALGAGAALALAASVMIAATSFGLLRDALRAPGGGARAEVIGDTVVGTLHDTVRLVRFVFEAPAASRVEMASVAGSAPAARTPLARSRTGAWSAVLPLAPGRYTFRFVADDARAAEVPVVIAPPAARARAAPHADGDST